VFTGEANTAKPNRILMRRDIYIQVIQWPHKQTHTLSIASVLASADPRLPIGIWRLSL